MTERDVALEAFQIAASFVDADGRHTDEELRAVGAAFAQWLPHLAGATPNELRNNGLVAGTREWKVRPSPMLDVLLATDTRDGSQAAHVYYEHALLIAHAVCDLDEFPARDELVDLERFRSMLISAMGPNAPLPEMSGAPDPVKDAETLADLLAELDDLIGLKGVKEEVRLVTSLLQVQRLRRERGLPVVETSRHLVFTGNPGTGKTTVARLLARIYRVLGVVEKGQLIESDRSQLVAGYVGQTALRVREVVTSALGGVLLIDEAYALARGSESDFGREAIDTLVKLMEDHRDELVVIAAGYPDEMSTFVESNPGLRSRFQRTIHFEDYGNDELLEIFDSMCDDGGYRLTSGARERVVGVLAAQERGRGFGNGRMVRNLFEAAVAQQSLRVVRMESPSDRDLATLSARDIPPGPSSSPAAGA
jgi:Holliday junction resolvasome RuvABC ATP-dependent DNA helicase subunit